MNERAARALERRIGVVLEVGTWVASAVIAIGLARPPGTRLVTAGIALFIALPVVRVVVMLVEFVRRGDRRIGAIAAIVLAVIVLAIALNARTNALGG